MRRRHLVRSKKPGLFSFIIIVTVFVLLVECFFYLERSLRPSIISIAIVRADVIATRAINQAIIDKIGEEMEYEELIELDKDEQGRIVMAQLNSMHVNRLMSETTLATQEALTELEKEEPMSIPLGEAMDNYLLATYGPGIPVRLIPLGRVNTRLEDSFKDAGINQVRHKIYLKVDTEVHIIVPFVSKPIEVVTSVPLADTVYQGEVPDTVVDLNLPDEGFMDWPP